LLLSNLFLLSGVYLAAFALQVLWYGLAAAGWLHSVRHAIFHENIPHSAGVRR